MDLDFLTFLSVTGLGILLLCFWLLVDVSKTITEVNSRLNKVIKTLDSLERKDEIDAEAIVKDFVR